MPTFKELKPSAFNTRGQADVFNLQPPCQVPNPSAGMKSERPSGPLSVGAQVESKFIFVRFQIESKFIFVRFEPLKPGAFK